MSRAHCVTGVEVHVPSEQGERRLKARIAHEKDVFANHKYPYGKGNEDQVSTVGKMSSNNPDTCQMTTPLTSHPYLYDGDTGRFSTLHRHTSLRHRGIASTVSFTVAQITNHVRFKAAAVCAVCYYCSAISKTPNVSSYPAPPPRVTKRPTGPYRLGGGRTPCFLHSLRTN